MICPIDTSSHSQIVIYQTEAGTTKIEVRLEDETVWLTQKQMADLFQVKPQNITIHLKKHLRIWGAKTNSNL